MSLPVDGAVGGYDKHVCDDGNHRVAEHTARSTLAGHRINRHSHYGECASVSRTARESAERSERCVSVLA